MPMVTLPTKTWGNSSLFLGGSGLTTGVGVGEGTGVGVAVGVAVGTGVGLGVGDGVGVGSGWGVGVTRGVGVGVGALVRSTWETQAVKTNKKAVDARIAPRSFI